VVASREGLFIKDMRADEKIEVSEGYKLSSLAPWVFLKDAWRMKGDFSLPVIRDRTTYETLRKDPATPMGRGVIHHR